MRHSGKVSLLSLFAVVVIAMVLVVFLFSRNGPRQAGAEFMDALVRGDVNKLTQLSYFSDPSISPDEIHREWDFAVNTSGKHYNFDWKITADTQTGNTGTVQLSVERNAGNPGAYAENYALPMTQVNGTWKVDVAGISRELFPGLPRGHPI